MIFSRLKKIGIRTKDILPKLVDDCENFAGASSQKKKGGTFGYHKKDLIIDVFQGIPIRSL